MRHAARAYRPALDFALAQTWIVVVVAVVLLGGAGVLGSRLGGEFTPQLDEGSITTMVYKPVGMSLPTSLAIEKATERTILQRISPGHPRLLADRHQRGRDRPDAAERERPLHLLQAR